MTENKADQMKALLKIRQIANGGGHPRLIIAKIYDIATRASRLDASVVVADMKQCPSVNAYVADYEYRGDQDYKPNEHEQAMIEDAIEGYIAERALAAPQPAADHLREAAFKLSCQDQFDLATEIAANVGYVLVTEPQPDRVSIPVDLAEKVVAPQPAAPLGGREAIARIIWSYEYGYEPDEYQIERSNPGKKCLGIAGAILAAIPQERGVERDGEAGTYDDDGITHASTYDEGITYAIMQLAELTGSKDWQIRDGSEDHATDVQDTIMDVLKCAGLYDDETGKLATIATTIATERDALVKALDDSLVTLHGLIDHPGDPESWDDAKAVYSRLLPLLDEPAIDTKDKP